MRTEFRKGHNKISRRCCGPICWTFLIFKTLAGVLLVTIISVNYFTHSSWYLWRWGSRQDYFAPCHDLEPVPVWQLKLPKLGSGSNLRLVNITKDPHLDIIMGFGTGADGYDVPDFACDIYFNGQKPCFGGVLAIDGKTGKRLWTLWAKHEIFAITCQGDLNKDGTIDCVAGGRAGVFFALSGATGELLWEFSNDLVQSDLMSVYVAQFIDDLNQDGVPEILAVHGGDPLSDPALEEKMFGRLIIFDGKNGEIFKWMQTPDRRESYYPPQLLTSAKGEKSILFGTGGNSRSGSLWVITIKDLLERKLQKAKQIYHDEEKGMLTPAALVDINGDAVNDIVIATFSSKVLAFDGTTYQPIWNVTFEQSETYSTIAVGYYDEDTIPDFLVKYQHGKGFPIYEYENTVVLSGKDGSKISKALTDSIGSNSSPLSISIKGPGNDIFLHWMANCKGHDKEKLKYSFPSGESMHDQMRADICHSLFGTQQESTFLGLLRFNESNEATVYNSLYWDSFEHANATNTSAMAKNFLNDNPSSETEFKSLAKDNDYSVLPKLGNDFHDVYAELEKILAEDPNRVQQAYAEAAEDPIQVGNVVQGNLKTFPFSHNKLLIDKSILTGKANPGEEVVSNLNYGQAHNVRKYPSHLAPSQQDNYENPYSRQYPPQMPQYPQQNNYPSYPQPNYGKRRKRDTSKDYNAHWGIHQIMSTGTLAPPLHPSKSNDTIDLIIATHWIYPSRTPVLQAEDEKCLNDELSKRPGTFIII